MKQLKMYIPMWIGKCKHSHTGQTCTHIRADKIKCLQEFLPDQEILGTHYLLERAKAQKSKLFSGDDQDKEYSPEPFIIKIDDSKFKEIIREINRKAPTTAQKLTDAIPISTQCQNLSFCIIIPNKEDDKYEQKN